ncbi:MAG: hypothetical protein M3Z20_15695 [Chloroflexota bacterium]|nr:hypothetical protein [Chloroflexota bacterium]
MLLEGAAVREGPSVPERAFPAVSTTPHGLGVAARPVGVGLSGDDYARPDVFTNGYALAMRICVALLALGGLIAWLTIRNDVLAQDAS